MGVGHQCQMRESSILMQIQMQIMKNVLKKTTASYKMKCNATGQPSQILDELNITPLWQLSQALIFRIYFGDHTSVLREHFSGCIEKYEVESSKRLAAADGDVKKSPCKVGIWRSRRAHDVLLGAGSLGLMNGSGVCSLQR